MSTRGDSDRQIYDDYRWARLKNQLGGTSSNSINQEQNAFANYQAMLATNNAKRGKEDARMQQVVGGQTPASPGGGGGQSGPVTGEGSPYGDPGAGGGMLGLAPSGSNQAMIPGYNSGLMNPSLGGGGMPQSPSMQQPTNIMSPNLNLASLLGSLVNSKAQLGNNPFGLGQ